MTWRLAPLERRTWTLFGSLQAGGPLGVRLPAVLRAILSRNQAAMARMIRKRRVDGGRQATHEAAGGSPAATEQS